MFLFTSACIDLVILKATRLTITSLTKPTLLIVNYTFNDFQTSLLNQNETKIPVVLVVVVLVVVVVAVIIDGTLFN